MTNLYDITGFEVLCVRRPSYLEEMLCGALLWLCWVGILALSRLDSAIIRLDCMVYSAYASAISLERLPLITFNSLLRGIPKTDTTRERKSRSAVILFHFLVKREGHL